MPGVLKWLNKPDIWARKLLLYLLLFLHIQIQENVSHQDAVSYSVTSLLSGEDALIIKVKT